MENKVISLDSRRPSKRDFIDLNEYQLGGMALVLDPSTQLQMIKSKAIHYAQQDDPQVAMKALDVIRLATVLESLQRDTIPPLKMNPCMYVRQEKSDDKIFMQVVYIGFKKLQGASNNPSSSKPRSFYMSLTAEHTKQTNLDHYKDKIFPGKAPMLRADPYNQNDTSVPTAIFQRMRWLADVHHGKIYWINSTYYLALPFAPADQLVVGFECEQFAD